MPIAKIDIDFNPFPDNWSLGHRYLQGGFTFEHQGATTMDLVINETQSERGLIVPSDDGVLIALPVLVHAFGFRLGTFAGPVEFEYFDEDMQQIGLKSIDWGNRYQDFGASLNKGLKYLRFSSGANEGLLRSLYIILECNSAVRD